MGDFDISCLICYFSFQAGLKICNICCHVFLNSLAIELNKKYSKAFMKRARAYEKLDRKEECLQGLSLILMS